MQPVVNFLAANAALFATLGGIATVLGLAFALYKAAHNQHVHALKDRIEGLEAQLAEYKKGDPEGLKMLAAQLAEQLDGAKRALQEAAARCAALEEEAASREAPARGGRGPFARGDHGPDRRP